MAKMLPATIADDHGSQAERIVFRKLERETPSEWRAIHSLGLANHVTKPWAEIDFVVITDGGVLCLEVKGGEIEHRAGDWFTNGNRMKQSPFAQAGGGAAALYDYVAGREPAVRSAFVGYGVLFPQCRFDAEMPSIASELIYDDRDLASPMSIYVERLTDYWSRRISNQTGRPRKALAAPERSRILHELAPDFDLMPTLHARIAEVDEELIRLTERQKELLVGLTDEPRVLVRGGAGTGKTLLAREEAVRLARDSRRTGLLCYGSRLAAYLRETVVGENVEVWHLHGLMSRLIDEAELRSELPAVEERDLFDIYYPQLAIDALARLERFGEFGALVLDEGQDILKPAYVQFLDALLDGEMARGVWRIFYDPNQDIFMGGSPAELERLEDVGVAYRLTKNCRNTREIALATSFLSGVSLSETLVVEGPDVVEAWGHAPKDLQRAVTRILRSWIDRGLDPGQIVVLSPRTFARSIVADIDRKQLPRNLVDIGSRPAGSGEITFCTIAGFKGLEADAVLLVDIDDISAPERLELFYTGATRARSVLGFVLDDACREVYSERVSDIVGQLMGKNAAQAG